MMGSPNRWDSDSRITERPEHVEFFKNRMQDKDHIASMPMRFDVHDGFEGDLQATYSRLDQAWRRHLTDGDTDKVPRQELALASPRAADGGIIAEGGAAYCFDVFVTGPPLCHDGRLGHANSSY